MYYFIKTLFLAQNKLLYSNIILLSFKRYFGSIYIELPLSYFEVNLSASTSMQQPHRIELQWSILHCQFFGSYKYIGVKLFHRLITHIAYKGRYIVLYIIGNSIDLHPLVYYN